MKSRNCEFKLKLVTVKDMEMMIKTMRPSSASGVDWIDSNCIKLAVAELSPALTHITNLSIKQGVFPTIYKASKVVPLKKATDLSDVDCNSYRPVNLLPQAGKIVERAVFIQLTEYLETNKLLHQNHHGGRKGHSTVTALLQLYDKWVELMEEGKLVGIMMIDQSAAFDLCYHEILKRKIRILCGGGAAENSWVSSYLEGRTQQTLIDGYLSAPVRLPPYSVIQGGVGAGILYLVYTCDLPDTVHSHATGEGYSQPEPYCEEDGMMVNFVDDSTAFYGSRNPEEISKKLDEIYSRVENWMAANKLVINGSKTHLLVAASRAIEHKRKDVTLNAGGSSIVQSDHEKLLGGIVSHDCRWNMMIVNSKKSVVNQLTSRVNALKLLHCADVRTRLMVATATIQSKLQYLMPLWGGAPGYVPV